MILMVKQQLLKRVSKGYSIYIAKPEESKTNGIGELPANAGDDLVRLPRTETDMMIQ